MKKSYKFKDLDCANCAAKIEAAAQKIEGITAVSVNFMTQKLILETASDEVLPIVLQSIQAIIKKIEPNCTLML